MNKDNILINQVCHGLLGLIFHRDLHKDWKGTKNFKDNEHVASIWGERKFEDWPHRLLIDERQAIDSYIQQSEDVNYHLREFNGRIDEKEDLTGLNIAEYRTIINQIRNIDKALAKSKIEKPIKVYRRVREMHFYPVGDVIDKKLFLKDMNGKINLEVFSKIMNEFILNKNEYYDPSYVSTSLSKDPPEMLEGFRSRPILLKIEVPAGTNVAYLGLKSINQHYPEEQELLIARGQNFKYEYAKIITNQLGQKTVLVKVKLISKKN